MASEIITDMRYLYLHGFASTPGSRKAQAFREALTDQGIDLEIPRLDAGDFSHVTLTAQLTLIEDMLRGDPVRITGSSMGGYLASLYASTHPEVDRLALLAPAFSFAERWRELVGMERLEQWKSTGWLQVFHYGTASQQPVHYGLFEDALKYPAMPRVTRPTRIFHGRNDAVVPIGYSRDFTALNENVRLEEFDSDHELLNVLPAITKSAVAFLTREGGES